MDENILIEPKHKDVYDAVVWGGLYEVKHSRWNDSTIGNDQIYYTAVPALDKEGNVWMQDTYQIESSGLKDGSSTLAAMERIFKLREPKSGDWVIKHSMGQWYHTGNEKITNIELLDDYELICNLHEYRPLKRSEDYRYFNPEAVLHNIHLYKEHGYSWNYGDKGVILVKKSAQPSAVLEFKSKLSDTRSSMDLPYSSSFRFSELQTLREQLMENKIDIDPRTEVKYKNLVWLHNRLNEMSEEIKLYLEEHKYRDHYDFEDSEVTLSQLHPDLTRYLEEDCYCPHEIYDRNGFSYELYYPSNKCQLIAKSDKKLAAVARTSDSSYPQCIMFWYDDESHPDKIVAAQRVDATATNLEICKRIVEEKPYNGKELDKFESNITSSQINEILKAFELQLKG